MILLFNPPVPDGRGYTREGRCTQEVGVWATQWPPVSLATAAALLRKDGHSVTVRDYPALGLDSRALVEDMRKLKPVFAIWSTGTPTLPHDLALARIVGENTPETVTAVIGTHVTVCPDEALQELALDVAIRGEPEGIIRELCRSTPPFSGVAGISYRDPQTGAVRHNPDAPHLSPGAIPAPSWEGFDLDVYRLPLKGRRFLMVAPVRGCPYRCNFCTAPLYYGKKLRKRPVKDVVEEIREDVSRHKIRDFFIWADTFTADRDYVRQLCQAMIENNLRISWTCNSRVDTIDGETLALMKEAGLWMISFGLESGNDKVLAMTGKGIAVAQARAAVLMAHQTGVKVAGHFILGLPGETEKTMKETLTLALALPLDIAQFYVATPFPGTELYREAVKNGWLSPNSNLSQDHASMELPGLSTEKVNAFRRMAYRRFYTRPVALGRILSMLEWGVIGHFLINLKRFLKYNF